MFEEILSTQSIQFETVEQRVEFLENVMEFYLSQRTVRCMIEYGFCSAPASTKYHGSYEGGLFDHSLAVTRALCELTDRLDLSWDYGRSPVVVGMLHDLCKIDSYKLFVDDRDGETVQLWRYDNSPIVKGHGEKSVIYAQQYGVQLNSEEIACILYHMGAYETDRWNAFDHAIKQYPNVLYTHMADMIASKILGV